MNCGTRLYQSRNVTATVVFTMNTTVFAEEAAEVDSVGVKEEVELADVDAVGTTLASDTNSEEKKHPEGKLASATNAYNPWEVEQEELETRGHILKDFKVTADADGTVVLKNVSNPVSWCNVVDKWNNGKASTESDANTDADDTTDSVVAHYEAGSLIETILTGSNKEDTYLINNDVVKVSENKYYSEGMRPGYRTYDVQKLDDTHFLFVGYGGNADTVYNEELKKRIPMSQAFASDALGKFTPVFTFDGRTIAYDKSGKKNSSKGKNERLDVDIALVKYENNTVTKIPGVTVASVKVGKDAKNATVSGQSILTITKDNKKNVYTVISDKQPSFTIKAKIDGKESEAKAQKKAINKLLKSDACKYTFEISQYVVDVAGYWFDNTKGTETGSVSASKAVADKNLLYYDGIDSDKFTFDSDNFTISKMLVDKKKANLVFNVDTQKGDKTGTASIKLKAGTDYTLEAGSLKGTTVAVLNFKDKGNFIYRDSRSSNTFAGAGYKWAFRATPSTDKKDKKKFRIGYYKNTNDGFCYSVEE